MFCFDKTGTLTKTDLDVIGVVPLELSAENTPILGEMRVVRPPRFSPRGPF